MGFLQLSKLVTGVLVVLTAWLLAPLIWQIAALFKDVPTPQFSPASVTSSAAISAPNTDTASLVAEIQAHHLFGQAARPAQDKPAAVITATQEVKQTRLNIKLLGLVSGQNGVAVINFEGKQGAYRIDEVISDKRSRRVTLAAIAQDHVIIYNNDVAEKLLLPKKAARSAAIASASSTPREVSLSDPAFTELLGQNPKRTLTSNPLALTRFMSLAPQRNGNRLAGYRIQAGRDTRLLERAGLNSGDLITHINNIPATNLDIPQLYQIISNTAAVSLTLQRNGKPVTMDIRL